MYSETYLKHYARDRHNESLRYAEAQRAAPSFRQRLAYKLQALAAWVEPKVKVSASDTPYGDAPLTLKRA